MPSLIQVLLIAAWHRTLADGELWELTVRDMATGADGSLVVTEDEFRALCGDCPQQDLIEVEAELVRWAE